MAQTKYEQLELLRKLSLRIQREIVDIVASSHNLKMIKDIIEGTPDDPSAADVFDKLTVAQVFKAGLFMDLDVFLRLQTYHRRVPGLLRQLGEALGEKKTGMDNEAWLKVVISIAAQANGDTDKPTEWSIPCLEELVDNQLVLEDLNHLRSRNVNKRFHKLALNVACPAP